jgi:hypothetical protein
MNIDRRQFIQGVLAAGVVAVSAGAVTAPAQGATLARTGSALSSAESFLLASGRRALG